MRLDFDFQLKRIDGQDFEGEGSHAGKVLGNALSSMSKGNSLKLWDWAKTVWAKKPLEIDNTDVDMLRALIESSELPNITKAQFLEIIK